MKKLSYLFLGAAGLLLASCSNEKEVAPAQPETGNFTVTVQLPAEMGTRGAFGEGYVAQELLYAVYDGTTGAYISSDRTDFPANSLSTDVTFNLAKGKFYNIAFLALNQNAANVYTIDYPNALLKVDYSKMTSADNLLDYYDCFWNNCKTEVMGDDAQSVNVTLTRPLAQINWGANDLSYDATSHGDAFGANGQNIVSYLSAKVYSQMHLVTGIVGGAQQTILPGFAAPSTSPLNVEFPYNPNADMANSANPYVYVAMNYVLANSTSDLMNLTLSITNEGASNVDVTGETAVEVNVNNVPVQANYQTNIYGGLLMNNLDVTVTKDPMFEGENNYPYPQN